MLCEWLMPQLQENIPDGIYQQNGAHPHFHNEVKSFFNEHLPQPWIGCKGPIEWPPRSPDLMPMDFFLWGYEKDNVYIPPLPTTLQELRPQIREAFVKIDEEMKHRVWQEVEYRYDVVRVTQGAHIELYQRLYLPQ
ncbi:hypothetical protein J437_LFUL016273 [Ladona fulva]|uniref:Uncharacterized protein n=1 Tax=Ladona fulva TaxID=123851 RepID=A0A8K0KIN3_LADFU|nr:hypothetical protein J437_LFUL016273 [Ladona fulva]